MRPCITLPKREKEAYNSFHVHLRQGAMSKLVTPHVALGGIKTAYVMVGFFKNSHQEDHVQWR